MHIDDGDLYQIGTKIEYFTRLTAGGMAENSTVVGGSLRNPADDRGTQPGLSGHQDVSGNTHEGRRLYILDGDIEGGGDQVPGGVLSGVGDGRGSDREQVAWIVRTEEGTDLAVVSSGGHDPLMRRSTLTRFRTEHHILRHATDDGQLQVNNADDEAGITCIPGGVYHRVLNSGKAMRKEVSRRVACRTTVHCTVVGHRRNHPAMSGTTKARLGGQGHVGEDVLDLRHFVVGDGNEESRFREVAVRVDRCVCDRSGTHIKSVPGK